MKKINIAKILNNCQKGMELDCTMYEDVYFDYVDELNIIHCYVQHENYKTSITFNQHGTPNSDIKSKCVIFPKGKTTWEGFQRPFKDGDIVYGGEFIAIVKNRKDNLLNCRCFVMFCSSPYLEIYGCSCRSDSVRFATEEEKQKLFDAIKDNGYKWNPETKTLEKLPKFKVGDRVRNKNYKDYIYDIHDITDKGYRAKEIDADSPIIILFGSQEDNYELAPNKFDITTLKPFDKVLTRDNNTQEWVISFFSHCNGLKTYKYSCLNGNGYAQCIPYEECKHLLGKTDDCDEYYKTWE